MTIHTETHWITEDEKMCVTIQEGDYVYISFFESPKSFAANEPLHEYKIPYEFLEEILRIRKPQ